MHYSIPASFHISEEAKFLAQWLVLKMCYVSTDCPVLMKYDECGNQYDCSWIRGLRMHMSNRHPVTIGSALLSQAVYTLLVSVRLLQHILDCLEGLKFQWETVCIHGPAYPWGGTSLETVRCAKDYAKTILKKTPEVLSNVNLGKPLCGNLAYACPMYTADMHIAHTPVFVNAYACSRIWGLHAP